MEKKLKLQMTQTKLQRKLDENRGRRNLMKSQFGQFRSFPATQLQEQAVITTVKLGGQKLDPKIFKKCNYLFYELKDEDDGGEGGYKIDLSFEQKVELMYCGLSKFTDMLTDGKKNTFVGNNNQSILSSFVITNATIAEMRRIMASKCTVNLSGTTFNIFWLVKLINEMKSKNQQYLDNAAPVEASKKQVNEDDEEDGDGD